MWDYGSLKAAVNSQPQDTFLPSAIDADQLTVFVTKQLLCPSRNFSGLGTSAEHVSPKRKILCYLRITKATVTMQTSQASFNREFFPYYVDGCRYSSHSKSTRFDFSSFHRDEQHCTNKSSKCWRRECQDTIPHKLEAFTSRFTAPGSLLVNQQSPVNK